MSISKDLFLAILSMDSYNRGYGAGLSDGKGATDSNGNDIDGLGTDGSLVGAATVLNIPLPADAQNAGFYAIAYEVGEGVEGIASGTTIISYRGTDDFASISVANDVLSGWIGGTDKASRQGALAANDNFTDEMRKTFPENSARGVRKTVLVVVC